MSKGRVCVAMSGGVDSSVAALVLRDAGYEVVGLTMQLYDRGAERAWGRCCAPEDVADAREVAAELGIAHYVVNYEDRFRERVVDYFVGEYAAGRTPIPCIPCNHRLKFADLLERALALGADFLATGHYARLELTGGRARLLRARDPRKDQSYFLFGVPPEALARARFPLGEMEKAETREIARRAGLPTAEKRDSQEVCFVPADGAGAFVERALGGARAGEIVGVDGAPLGDHAGVFHYTVGQRRGLGVPSSDRLYVLELDGERNRVVVGGREGLRRAGLEADEALWIDRPEGAAAFEATVKIRYNAPDVPCVVRPDEGGFSLRFGEPQEAVAPGQAAVLYRDEAVLGGGFISRALAA
ncbi:MAG: tRNA 2-thiouridine(34) synthase MnmA [Candidatus Methylomirabilis sp.]|nr:tRNA 2-thiouridine(34) synthase MnmA [Deltaproteobacteria bacterium]